MKPFRKAAALIAAATLAGGSAGCAAPAGGGDAGKTLTVFAAASLQAPFTELAGKFEARNPEVKVQLSFAGSSDLAAQIAQGARADVFASADAPNMARLSDASLTEGAAKDFATNVLTIAVPASNPAAISTLADLARPGVKVVICASQVPCGTAARTVERAAGVALKPVSEESSVTGVLGKVASGEADAGLVYVTDVKAEGGKVRGVPFAEAGQAVNTYPIAALRGSRNAELAQAFLAMVRGPDGTNILRDAGFGRPGR
ncbi:MAG: molybdate-binding protein [Arthrobacter sp.]|nr:molybdate-binding protein [Arthrobacter sp.]